MDAKPLLCPSCGGQIKLHGDMFKEKMIACEFCGTMIDLHQEASNQEFDVDDFLKNFQNVTTTVSTNTVVIKNGKVISGDAIGTDDILKKVQEQLKDSGINIDGLIQQQSSQNATIINAPVINTPENNMSEAKPQKKGFWKKMFGS